LQQEFVKEILARLERAGVVYTVTGSIASNLWGTPRTTHDVDIVIVLTAADVNRMVAAFGDTYYLSEAAVREAVLQGPMFNVIDSSSGLKAGFWVAKGDPFNQSMLSRRCRLEIVPGQEAFVGTPEEVLLHKLVWNQITPSDRQLSDGQASPPFKLGLSTWNTCGSGPQSKALHKNLKRFSPENISKKPESDLR
jgi:hypothetical protein